MRHVQDQLEEGAVSNSKRLGFHQLSSIEGHSIEAYNAVLDSQQVALRELLSELESIQKQIFTLEQQASITVHDINSCKFESNPPVGDDVESISKKNSKMILLTKMLEGLSGISILEQSKFHLKIKISPLSTQFCVLHVLLGNDGKLSSIMLDEEQSNFTPPQYLEEIFSCSIEDQDLSFSIREISHALLSKK